MHPRRRRAVVIFLAAAIFLIGDPVGAQTLTTYDDFSSEQIDPSRWTGRQSVVRYGTAPDGWFNETESLWTFHPEFSVINTLVDRRIVGGQLRLQATSFGGTHDNTMASGHGRFYLRGTQWERRVT